MLKNTFLNIVCILFLLVGSINIAVDAEAVITNNGKAVLPIIVKSKENLEPAKTLADYLQKISGAKFEVSIRQDIPEKGIFLGQAKDFPQFQKLFAPENPFRDDEYLIKSVNGGIYLAGATDIALEHAVWDFLFRLGYRQFFPTKSWEIIPENKNIKVDIDIFENPDYYIRMIALGYGDWKTNAWRIRKWESKNRMARKCRLNSYHIYQHIIRENKEVFAEHPEYYGLYNGKRNNNRLCVSNLELHGNNYG